MEQNVEDVGLIMCGIIGIMGTSPVSDRLVEGLRRLEYRGYDSCGIATLEQGEISRRRAQGKLVHLVNLLKEQPLHGNIGIGHTRWATHGKPTTQNAHPHISEQVAVVHNGIFENFHSLKADLVGKGHIFETETDTEIIVHLITENLQNGLSPREAVFESISKLQGAFALVCIFPHHAHLMIGVCRGAPLAVGQQETNPHEVFLGSDALALAPFASHIIYLEDGDWVCLSPEGVDIRDMQNHPQSRGKQKIQSSLLVEKGNYRHFMAKEMHEQPEVVGRTLSHYINLAQGLLDMSLSLKRPIPDYRRMSIIGCGTAHLSGHIARYWIEHLANIPTDIDVASEFRYRDVPLSVHDLVVLVSQSGETADTLACLRHAKAKGATTIAIVNVPNSTIAREADMVLPTLAGPEIGVASTKAFTCQLATFACLGLEIAKERGELTQAQERAYICELVSIPGYMADILKREAEIEPFARDLTKAQNILYLGRGTSYPLALEGALKIKEISYIHAEGYAAGEIKHGPIALVEESLPVVVIAPQDALLPKTISNLQEVAAREGKIFLIGDKKTKEDVGVPLYGAFLMPELNSQFSALLYALPVQMLAYHTAVLMGKDVDQPRNLAKSVTVE